MTRYAAAAEQGAENDAPPGQASCRYPLAGDTLLLTAGFMILACAGDQPPVPSPARTVGFRVCGFREPTTGHTARASSH
jgi:hypothetical protein